MTMNTQNIGDSNNISNIGDSNIIDSKMIACNNMNSNNIGNISVALVLGGGGTIAYAWHAGVLQALHSEAGWDARAANLIIGTSCGAVAGLALRSGLSPSDMYATQTGQMCSGAGQKVLEPLNTEYEPQRKDCAGQSILAQWAPQAPMLTARALLRPPFQPLHALVGLLPTSKHKYTTETLYKRMSEVHPGQWPADRFWVPAVQMESGRRVVLGRDDVPTSVARAVQASCANPFAHEPVAIGEHRYLNGSLHSPTNADLAAPLGFDLVIVSSVMSGHENWQNVRRDTRKALRHMRHNMKQIQHNIRNGVRAQTSGQNSAQTQAPNSARAQTWVRTASDAWTQTRSEARDAWDNGRPIRAAQRQVMSYKLQKEVADIRSRGSQVLLAEPDRETAKLLDTPQQVSVQQACAVDTEDSFVAEIARRAREITCRQLSQILSNSPAHASA